MNTLTRLHVPRRRVTRGADKRACLAGFHEQGRGRQGTSGRRGRRCDAPCSP